jgi:hypothetical protein
MYWYLVLQMSESREREIARRTEETRRWFAGPDPQLRFRWVPVRRNG